MAIEAKEATAQRYYFAVMRIKLNSGEYVVSKSDLSTNLQSLKDSLADNCTAFNIQYYYIDFKKQLA